MFFPNSNSENVYSFSDVTKFPDAVAAFKRGANVFYQDGTTYDMMTAYEGGALKGSKYTVDENGASETGGGGGESDLFVARFTTTDGQSWACDKTYSEIDAAHTAHKVVVGTCNGMLLPSCLMTSPAGGYAFQCVVASYTNGAITRLETTEVFIDTDGTVSGSMASKEF